MAISALSYLPINRATHSGHILAGSLDSHIPLVPVFAIPYILFLPVFWAAVIYALITGRNFTRLAVSLIAVYLFSDLVYWLYPTMMPRSGTVHGFLSGWVRYIYDHDRVFCDLPSEHVASATIFAAYFWSFGRRVRLSAAVFAVLVIASTLFLKQHSIGGVIGGLVLAGAVLIGLRFRPRRSN